MRRQLVPHLNQVVGTPGMHALEDSLAIEHRVREGHASSKRRWHHHVMDHDCVAIHKQTVATADPTTRTTDHVVTVPSTPES